MDLGKYLQTGDWKGEKHVPVIHATQTAEAGKPFEVKISIGDAVAHPNTLEHHIAWFKVFYMAEDGKFPVEVANFNFSVHGEAGAFTDPVGAAQLKLQKSGKIIAVSYCNIHGLWVNQADITVS